MVDKGNAKVEHDYLLLDQDKEVRKFIKDGTDALKKKRSYSAIS